MRKRFFLVEIPDKERTNLRIACTNVGEVAIIALTQLKYVLGAQSDEAMDGELHLDAAHGDYVIDLVPVD